MALLDKPPNGGHPCEKCRRDHAIRDKCDVKYDPKLEKWLCNECWVETPSPAPPRPRPQP